MAFVYQTTKKKGQNLCSLVERSSPFPRHGAYGQTLCTQHEYSVMALVYQTTKKKGHKLCSLVERSSRFPRHGAYGQTLCTSTRYWPLYTKPTRRKAIN